MLSFNSALLEAAQMLWDTLYTAFSAHLTLCTLHLPAVLFLLLTNQRFTPVFRLPLPLHPGLTRHPRPGAGHPDPG